MKESNVEYCICPQCGGKHIKGKSLLPNYKLGKKCLICNKYITDTAIYCKKCFLSLSLQKRKRLDRDIWLYKLWLMAGLTMEKFSKKFAGNFGLRPASIPRIIQKQKRLIKEKLDRHKKT